MVSIYIKFMKENQLKVNKILLIAGNGFIGGHIVEWLHKKYEIHILSRRKIFKCDYFNKYKNEVKFIELKSLNELPDISINDYYCIVNLLTIIKPSKGNELFIDEISDELHFNNLLLSKMDNSVKYIYCSSAGTLYEPNGNKQIETSPLAPANEYGLLKSLNEQIIKYFHKNSIILRISNPIGYGQSNIDKKGLVTQMALNLINKNEMVLYAPDQIIKDYFDIDDLCILIDKMLNNFKPDVYNVCYGKSYSITFIKDLLEGLTNNHLNYKVEDINSYDNQLVIISNDKIKNEYSVEFNSLENTCIKLLNQLYERM